MEPNEATPAELLAERFKDNTASRIKDAQLALQRAFEIQKRYDNRRHRPLFAYAAGDYDTVRLKPYLITVFPTYK